MFLRAKKFLFRPVYKKIIILTFIKRLLFNVTLKRVSKDQTRGGDFSNLLGTDESLRLNREKVASI